MQNYIVAVVNSTKARFFVLESDELETEPNFRFTEIEELCSSTQELQGQDLWSTTKPGRNRGTAGQAHGYDDHRENHQVEFIRRFAREITAKLSQLIKTSHSRQLLLVAEPNIMGIMRDILTPDLPKNLKLNELTKDLCQLKAHELHEYLAKKDLLPV
uniref:Host attachment protein n=1 Tax=Oscillatoriales cyanobacterium SpSt-402 TaxID=2282168 RepID=A0A832M1A6_9CYAN